MRAGYKASRDALYPPSPPKELQSKTFLLVDLIDKLPTPVFVKNLEGAYIACNLAFTHLLGLEKDEIIGKKSLDIPSLRYGEEYTKKDSELLRNPEYQQKYEYVITDRDGRTRNVIFNKNILSDSNGTIWGIIGCIEDITPHKNQQKNLEKLNKQLEERIENELADKLVKEKLLIEQSKNATMGEMIGVIAHQWKQPLNIVSIIAQELRMDSEDGELNPDSIAYYTDRLLAQVEYMNSTINDFRNFFKKGELQKRSIMSIVNESVRLLSEELKISSIELYIEGDDFEVMTSSSELKQVFINLVVNAKDQIATKKPVNKNIVIRCDSKARSIEVCDYAGGVSEDVKDILFEPYVSTKGDKGTGIGLYMVKMIVEDRLEGNISITNKDGGASFKISFK